MMTISGILCTIKGLKKKREGRRREEEFLEKASQFVAEVTEIQDQQCPREIQCEPHI